VQVYELTGNMLDWYFMAYQETNANMVR